MICSCKSEAHPILPVVQANVGDETTKQAGSFSVADGKPNHNAVSMTLFVKL
jgi:hypothetical protein